MSELIVADLALDGKLATPTTPDTPKKMLLSRKSLRLGNSDFESSILFSHCCPLSDPDWSVERFRKSPLFDGTNAKAGGIQVAKVVIVTAIATVLYLFVTIPANTDV